MSRPAAWILWAWTVGLAAFSVTFVVVGDETPELLIPAFLALALGSLILTRLPRNAIGAVLHIGGASWLLYEGLRQYAVQSFEAGPFPGEYLAGWLGTWIGPIFFMTFPTLLLLFPDGRALGWRRWFLVVIAGVAGLTVLGAVQLWGVPFETLVDSAALDGNPRYVPTDLAFVLSLFLSIPAVVSVVLRFRAGSQVERQQIKWLLLGSVTLAIGLIPGPLGLEGTRVWEIFLALCMSLFPLAIGLAIFRYRLYEIDRIVSRTVSYGLVVGALAVVFAAGVVWIPSALGLRDAPLLVAGSTLAVAGLFNPLRRRVQRWVDRRFNRSRYHSEQVIEQFAGSLRNRVDPDGVVDGWVGVVAETMQPSSVAVWVRE